MDNSLLRLMKNNIALLLFLSITLISQIIFILLCFNPVTLPFVVIYYISILLDKTHTQGGNLNFLFKNNILWKWFSDHFDSKVIFDEPLNPTSTYLFGYHPHGIFGAGVFANFASGYSDFYKALPGFVLNMVTLNMNFYMPFHREILLGMGFISADKESIKNALEKKHSCLIAVGGAAEALLAQPGTAEVLINNRKGFVKLALQTGASLVPVYSFGESATYTQFQFKKGSTGAKIQNFIKNKLSFSTPIIYGRGFTDNSYGLLPRRVQIISIIGKPIKVEKVDNPSSELISEVHERYKSSLKEIYDKYKSTYSIIDPPPPLQFH